jgi:putative Holliday junction resolvase
LSNEPSSIAGAIDAFRRELQVDLPEIPQHEIDERFTTRIALQTIAGSDLPRLKRRDKGLADRISAVLLLQSYLETIQHQSAAQATEDVSISARPARPT